MDAAYRVSEGCNVIRPWFTAVVGALLCVPLVAGAQTDASTQLDPSVRAVGMGGASGAVTWGDDVNDWANPALLGYHAGLQYRWTHERLVPALADVVFSAHRVTYGWGGLGLEAATQKLDFGESEGTDTSGNPTGTFNSFERSQPLSFGLSVSRFVDALALLRGGEAPAFTRYVDVAAGYGYKNLKVQFGPPGTFGTASSHGSDYGLLVKVSPIPPSADHATFDLAYGFSVLNFDDPEIQFPGEQPILVNRQYRNSGAIHLAVPASAEFAKAAEGHFGWIGRGMQPLISAGFATDFSHFQPGEASAFGREEKHYGLEVAALNVLSLRIGHFESGMFDISGTSWGIGVGVPLGGFAGVRYDYASEPLQEDTDPLSHHG